MFVLILRQHEQAAAPPPPYDFGPSPKVAINSEPSVPTSITPEKISVIDNTNHGPPPYGPMDENLASSSPVDGSPQGRASSTQSVPRHGNSPSTLNTQSVPPHEAYHQTHGHPIPSPIVSVHSSVGDITGTTITNVGNNNSYGRFQARQSAPHHNAYYPRHGHPNSSPSVSVITNTDAQSIPHHNAYHLPQGRPSVSVHSGEGKITGTLITNVGDNNIYEDS